VETVPRAIDANFDLSALQLTEIMLTILVVVGQQNSLQMEEVEVVQKNCLAEVAGSHHHRVEGGVIVVAEQPPVGSTDNMQRSSGSPHMLHKDHRPAGWHSTGHTELHNRWVMQRFQELELTMRRQHRQSCSCYCCVSNCYLDLDLFHNHRCRNPYLHLLHIHRCKTPSVVEVDWP